MYLYDNLFCSTVPRQALYKYLCYGHVQEGGKKKTKKQHKQATNMRIFITVYILVVVLLRRSGFHEKVQLVQPTYIP